jgi:hypothetical protein
MSFKISAGNFNILQRFEAGELRLSEASDGIGLLCPKPDFEAAFFFVPLAMIVVNALFETKKNLNEDSLFVR